MRLEERLNQALAKHQLNSLGPEEPVNREPVSCPTPIPVEETQADYKTIAQGLKSLSKHQLDEDGIGCFTAKRTGLKKIQLPMTVGDFVVEDIQRVKTGDYQVHFRKSEND